MSSWPRITVAQKGLFVFLLDQSGSMASEWTPGKTRAEQVSTLVNKVIFELMVKGEDPAGFRDRFDVLCIGYGSSVGVAMAAPFSDVAIHSSKELNDAFGGNTETVPSYVVAKHDAGGTNMNLAFAELEQILPAWVAKHPDSAPPIVFHITDGENTGTDPKDIVDRIKDIKTSVSGTLVWNIYVSSNINNTGGAALVKDPSAVIDPHAKFLLSLSSKLPNIPEFGELADHYAMAYDVSPKHMLELLRVGSVDLA
jgi:hypothetical protein